MKKVQTLAKAKAEIYVTSSIKKIVKLVTNEVNQLLRQHNKFREFTWPIIDCLKDQ